jgi:hypothetical protein
MRARGCAASVTLRVATSSPKRWELAQQDLSGLLFAAASRRSAASPCNCVFRHAMGVPDGQVEWARKRTRVGSGLRLGHVVISLPSLMRWRMAMRTTSAREMPQVAHTPWGRASISGMGAGFSRAIRGDGSTALPECLAMPRCTFDRPAVKDRRPRGDPPPGANGRWQFGRTSLLMSGRRSIASALPRPMPQNPVVVGHFASSGR